VAYFLVDAQGDAELGKTVEISELYVCTYVTEDRLRRHIEMVTYHSLSASCAPLRIKLTHQYRR
jgi:hypothetical protein